MSIPHRIMVARFGEPRGLLDLLAGRTPDMEEIAFEVKRLVGGGLDVVGPDDATPEEYEVARDYLRSCERQQ